MSEDCERWETIKGVDVPFASPWEALRERIKFEIMKRKKFGSDRGLSGRLARLVIERFLEILGFMEEIDAIELRERNLSRQNVTPGEFK